MLQCYSEKLLKTKNLNWKEIYILPRKVSLNANFCMLQYKILNNILFLHKLLFMLKKVSSALRSFCNSVDETPLHIFVTCNIEKGFWNELQYFVSQYRYVPEITLQRALLGFFNIGNQQQNFLLTNNLLSIFRYFLYMLREHGAVCFNSLKLYLIKNKTIEQNISSCSSQIKEKS